MELSREQSIALDRSGQWLASADKPVFTLLGAAGTGKTSIAKRLAEGAKGCVHFAAYTGKAAHVMRQQGCVGARTLHSLIYVARDKSQRHLAALQEQLFLAEDDAEKEKISEEIVREEANLGRPSFSLNLDSELRGASLLVIDECSMVDEQMAGDILSFKVPVLVLGDPFQLPPVFGQGHFTKAEPDYLLQQVHRHALDSPVYAMATEIREKGSLSFGPRGNNSGMFPADEIKNEIMACADQVLVGRNATRMEINWRIRRFNGIQCREDPVRGDKLVCLKNNHQLGLFNGSMWRVVEVGNDEGATIDLTVSSGESDGDELTLTAHKEPFKTGDKKKGTRWSTMGAEDFTFGCALTVHKAQGSQWPRVVVCDESQVFRRDAPDTPARWLYTAVTRASESVKVYSRPQP